MRVGDRGIAPVGDTSVGGNIREGTSFGRVYAGFVLQPAPEPPLSIEDSSEFWENDAFPQQLTMGP